MEFYQIKNIEDKWYKLFYEIYSVSFPIHEQRNEAQQIEAFNDERYYLMALVEKSNFCAFIAYWDFGNYVYIEHLAVNPVLRGNNIGSKSLQVFADIVKKTVLLEIDPLVDDISQRRLGFYERLGYKMNPYKHAHPAYNPKYKPHELIVLSYPEKITKEEYEQFYSDLANIVMKVNG